MKHLLLTLVFSASLAAFSQVQDTTQPLRYFDGSNWVNPILRVDNFDIALKKPDTLRAICLVTLFENGIAHARMGWVVIEQGKRPVYLDCRKRALKRPQVGWGWEIVNPNKEK